MHALSSAPRRVPFPEKVLCEVCCLSRLEVVLVAALEQDDLFHVAVQGERPQQMGKHLERI